MDNKIIQVALDGLENILKVGDMDKGMNNGTNPYALYIEEAGGMLAIHNLQTHENNEIYKKYVLTSFQALNTLSRFYRAQNFLLDGQVLP